MLRLVQAAVVLLATFATVFATPSESDDPVQITTCGTNPSDEQVRAYEAAFAARKADIDLVPRATTQAGVIPVYFHVISKDTTPAGGNVPDTQIMDQINVLNQDFAGTGFNFVLAGTTRIVNNTWFSQLEVSMTGEIGTVAYDMMSQLWMGNEGVSVLNLYSVGTIGPGSVTGVSTLPSSFDPKNPADDGVIFLYQSMPGGSLRNRNLGRVLTHEVGHWVGLYHTFRGGCIGDGDEVDDTPAEASGAQGCPTGRDSCPTLPGVDPINNYMDYSYDSCINEFTPGQMTRMKDQMAIYRNVVI